MFEKLQAHYSNALLFTEQPNFSFYTNYHWFKDRSSWLGIPVDAIQKQELSLLKTLFHYESLPFTTNPRAQKWYDFLFLNGEIPRVDLEASYRVSLFRLSGTEWDRKDIEEAINGFFHDDSVILWEDQENGIIIERDSDIMLNEELVQSIIQMLESDFYLKAYFYCGKAQPLTKDWPKLLIEDKNLFNKAIQLMPTDHFYTFEKCFPFILADQLPPEMKTWIRSQILLKIADEPELLTAVKRFLENNSNATLTAKQLYIHRNTLQYRLDKFATKTGINLKDFSSSITTYLACLLSQNKH